MRLITVIDDRNVIANILRHVNLWCAPVRFALPHQPPVPDFREPEPELLVDSHYMVDYANVITD